jgi:translocator protein
VEIKQKRGYLDIIVTVAVAFGVIAAGGALTVLGPWYQSLKMPAWQPPGPAFGIIWTTIYVLYSAAAVLAWRSSEDKAWARTLLVLIGINLTLNLLWSALFFKLHRPDWALIEVVPFWLSIVALIVFIWPKRKLASLMLAPYLVWVGIASFLNLAIVQLNGPF